MDNSDKYLINKNTKKKRKKQDLSSSVDSVLKKRKKPNKKINNSIRKKSKDDNNRKIHLEGINDYFRYNEVNYLKDEDINPDVENIEITQEDDSDNKKQKR